MLKGKCANIVSVIECDRAHFLQAQHAFDVTSDGIERLFFVGLRITFAQLERLFESHPVWHVSVQRIMSGGLVSQNVGDHASFCKFWNNVGTVSDQSHRNVFFFAHCVLQNAQSFIESGDEKIAIAGL